MVKGLHFPVTRKASEMIIHIKAQRVLQQMEVEMDVESFMHKDGQMDAGVFFSQIDMQTNANKTGIFSFFYNLDWLRYPMHINCSKWLIPAVFYNFFLVLFHICLWPIYYFIFWIGERFYSLLQSIYVELQKDSRKS